MKRSKHSLTHYKLLTCKMGQLVPVAWFEALPGDTIQHATSALIRCAPLVTPVMHPVHVRFHHFFVPNRLIWANWQNFITGGPDGMDTTQHPYRLINSPGVGIGGLYDYLGVPTSGLSSQIAVNALPGRAYALIWNEFYRDQDLQTPLVVSTGDGVDSTTNNTLMNISWEKDYLTSSRPWVVKGPSVTLPLGTQAPLQSQGVFQLAEFPTGANVSSVGRSGAGAAAPLDAISAGSGAIAMQYQSGLMVNLAGATAVDVNTVRHAFALQRFEEARARYGSRYTEYLRYLGVRSSDQRLQRPEYLGGGRQTIQFSEVLQTAPTTAGTGGGTGGVGQFGGHGITAMRSNRYRRFFEEHGIVMTLMSVRPRTMYSQRVKRAWLRGSQVNGLVGTKEDYWQRELQHIGQQGINGLEADASVGFATTFGYQDRYDEYRREESSVAGNFRTTLDNWHLSREFGSAPALNSTFVSCVPSTRVFADTASDNLYVMAHHSIQARRLVAREGSSSTF
jgi:Capsid protein (F protein)